MLLQYIAAVCSLHVLNYNCPKLQPSTHCHHPDYDIYTRAITHSFCDLCLAHVAGVEGGLGGGGGGGGGGMRRDQYQRKNTQLAHNAKWLHERALQGAPRPMGL